jgi:peptide deformylase
MPLVLLNPEVEPFGKPETGVEGCLSFPGARSDVTRPGSVRVTAQSLDGKIIEFEAGDLLARAVQHEHDHLHGILFIDRVSASERGRIEAEMNGAADHV